MWHSLWDDTLCYYLGALTEFAKVALTHEAWCPLLLLEGETVFHRRDIEDGGKFSDLCSNLDQVGSFLEARTRSESQLSTLVVSWQASQERQLFEGCAKPLPLGAWTSHVCTQLWPDRVQSSPQTTKECARRVKMVIRGPGYSLRDLVEAVKITKKYGEPEIDTRFGSVTSARLTQRGKSRL